jgi:hypothetical protein
MFLTNSKKKKYAKKGGYSIHEHLSMRYSDSKIKELIENLIPTFISRHHYFQKLKNLSNKLQQNEDVQKTSKINSQEQLNAFEVEQIDCAFEILDRFSKFENLESDSFEEIKNGEEKENSLSSPSLSIPLNQNQQKNSSKTPTKKKKETLKKKKKKLNGIMVNNNF